MGDVELVSFNVTNPLSFAVLSAIRGAISIRRHVLDGPRERVAEAHNQVDQRPANDDVVVGGDAESSEDGRQADTRQARVDAPEDTDVTTLELLAESQLHERNGQADEEEADKVGDEESSTAPREAEIGESPEVAEADTVANHSEDESHATEPARSLFFRIGSVIETPMKASYTSVCHVIFVLFYIINETTDRPFKSL